MTDRERQYQRVARVLDGEPLKLDAAEQALLDELRGQLESLGQLDVGSVPAPARARARRTMRDELRGGWRSVARRWVSVGLAAAAVLVIALIVHFQQQEQPGPGRLALPAAEVETLVLAMQTDLESQLLIDAAAEIDTLESQLTDSDVVELLVDPIDRSMEQLDTEIDELIEDDFDAPSLMKI
ncbi:MAG: hypothetical protein ACOCZE_08105 [Planctomycetota bacterium]